MSKAIKVSDGVRSMYVPMNSEHQARFERFASAGLIDVVDGVIHLRSEAGPMFWEMLKANPPQDQSQTHFKVLEAIDSDSINLSSNEVVSFGEKPDSLAYSKTADLSLGKQGWRQGGVGVALKKIMPDEILMTVWPKSQRMIPAKASNQDRRLSLELVQKPEKGERCFILDEEGKTLYTVSYASDGSEKIHAVNPVVFDALLVTAGSPSIYHSNDRFHVSSGQDGLFLIHDKKASKKYSGHFNHHTTEPDALDAELRQIEHLLASRGLGAILPTYSLKRA